uniref:Small ribosomal subunit protein mS33 n=1 Tax=Acrobeloides nanus TaxID=290746 RepID=A0A914DPM0_9BILA
MPMPTYRMMDQPVWDDKKAFGHGNYHFQKWNEQSEYAKRVCALSAKIWGEPTRPVNTPSARMIRSLSREPHEQTPLKPLSRRDDKTPTYWVSQTPMFHYMVKMLRFHGLFYDAHMTWKEAQEARRLLSGKTRMPVIGQGKLKELREKRRAARAAKAAQILAKAKAAAKRKY